MSILPFLLSCYTLFFGQSSVGFLLTSNAPLAIHVTFNLSVSEWIWREEGIVNWLWVCGLKDFIFLLTVGCRINGCLAMD